MSVKNSHNLILKTYKLWRSKIENEIKQKQIKRLKLAYKKRQDSLEGSDFEYGPKNILNKNRQIKKDDSKYFKNNKTNQKIKKRRWLSEENSRNESINLSARKVVLNKQKGNSRNNSLENVHTFYLKQSPSVKQLQNSNSNMSLNSSKFQEVVEKYELDWDWNENGNHIIYVEERVKMLKNSQHNHVYKSLKELWKQIKDFKEIYLLENENRK